MPCHAMSCSTYGEHQQNIDMHATVVTENIQSSKGTSLRQTAMELRGHQGQLTSQQQQWPAKRESHALQACDGLHSTQIAH